MTAQPRRCVTVLYPNTPGVIFDFDYYLKHHATLIDRLYGGSIAKLDIWGKRRLAYQIEKKPEGIYAVVDLTAEPATVQELDRQLNLNEAVLRTKVLRPEHR